MTLPEPIVSKEHFLLFYEVVSGIALTALQPEIAARDATKILASG